VRSSDVFAVLEADWTLTVFPLVQVDTVPKKSLPPFQPKKVTNALDAPGAE
jgi:hypothetical protein